MLWLNTLKVFERLIVLLDTLWQVEPRALKYQECFVNSEISKDSKTLSKIKEILNSLSGGLNILKLKVSFKTHLDSTKKLKISEVSHVSFA